MRILIFSAALVLTLASVNAKADCAMERDSVLPLTASKVPLNFKMVFSTANFNETRTHAVLVLKSKNETIALKSTLLIEGFSVLQFILVPEKPLKEKTTYQLLKVKTKEVLATYETTSALDTEAPAALPLMVKTERRYQEYGCGPARWAKFKLNRPPQLNWSHYS